MSYKRRLASLRRDVVKMLSVGTGSNREIYENLRSQLWGDISEGEGDAPLCSGEKEYKLRNVAGFIRKSRVAKLRSGEAVRCSDLKRATGCGP